MSSTAACTNPSQPEGKYTAREKPKERVMSSCVVLSESTDPHVNLRGTGGPWSHDGDERPAGRKCQCTPTKTQPCGRDVSRIWETHRHTCTYTQTHSAQPWAATSHLCQMSSDSLEPQERHRLKSDKQAQEYGGGGALGELVSLILCLSFFQKVNLNLCVSGGFYRDSHPINAFRI